MFELQYLIKSIGIYLLVCYGLYQIKHPKMFDENNGVKNFGLNGAVNYSLVGNNFVGSYLLFIINSRW